jgi:hypothetical protein
MMQMNADQIVMQIEDFIKTDKFLEDLSVFYPGLSHAELKEPLTKLINLSAEDFIEVLRNNPTDDKFQDKIKIGLDRIESHNYPLDSEDKDRVCHYFEELMDLVGLDDSGGHLNKWRYDLDF